MNASDLGFNAEKMKAMSTNNTIIASDEGHPRVDVWRASNEATAGYAPEQIDELRQALTGVTKYVPAVFLYDDLGSAIGDEIVDAKSYYLARKECELLDRHNEDIARLTVSPLVVELGSGSGKKNAGLLRSVQQQHSALYYMPNDINEKLMYEGAQVLADMLPGARIRCLAGTFEQAIQEVVHATEIPKLFMLLGSTISQLDDFSLLRFWRSQVSKGDQILIAFDLVKDPEIVKAAYSNSETQRHSANALMSLNRSFAGDFDPNAFEFVVRYHSELSRNETHQRSLKDQVVRLEALGREAHFAKGETIRTAYQRKFVLDDVTAQTEAIGLFPIARFTDEQDWYALVLFEAG